MNHFLITTTMKIYKLFCVLLLSLGSISLSAQVATDPYVNGATVNPAPIRTGPTFPMNLDPLSVSFNFGNSSSTAIQLNTLNVVNVSLSKIAPLPNDIIGGNPPYYYSVSTVGGDYFSVSYNPVINTLTFTQKAVIPGFAYETITISGLIATGESDDKSPQNGLNVNVAFLASANPNQVNDNTNAFTYTLPGGVLPIRLLNFNGIKEESKVQLKWETSSEQNSKYFDVEFSENTTQWNSIGKVNAAGNSNSKLNYALTHNTPIDGVNYYRLKQVDINGSFTYSNIVAITFTIKGVKVSSVFPNPFVSQVKVKVSSDRNELVRIRISDNAGRLVRVQNNSVPKGVNDISIDNLSALAPGVYYVEVKTSYSTFRYKLTK